MKLIQPKACRVTQGNLVTGGAGGNTTLLANIVSIDPIRLEFSFDEAAYLRYERSSSGGKEMTSRGVQPTENRKSPPSSAPSAPVPPLAPTPKTAK